MMSRLFQNVAVGVWTQISVIVFFAIFLAILAWVFLPIRKKVYEDAARLPLEGESCE